jgi:hypothetical protein
VASHLETCPQCESRSDELQSALAAISNAGRMQSEEFDSLSQDQGRLRLQRGLDRQPPVRLSPSWQVALYSAGSIAALLTASFLLPSRRAEASFIVAEPNTAITPGAVLVADKGRVCAHDLEKNRAVAPAVRRKVLEEYHIPDADPQAYEIDYLITPALGGSDNLQNLWPHSYSATVWNARVKDQLEDRLRGMVCDGSMDLRSAQQEIAENWIAAYKKYFHTDTPQP